MGGRWGGRERERGKGGKEWEGGGEGGRDGGEGRRDIGRLEGERRRREEGKGRELMPGMGFITSLPSPPSILCVAIPLHGEDCDDWEPDTQQATIWSW
jgi:hypothetical protein